MNSGFFLLSATEIFGSIFMKFDREGEFKVKYQKDDHIMGHNEWKKISEQITLIVHSIVIRLQNPRFIVSANIFVQ
ncbi:hypothetical protein H5410_063128 [Solanum commersonii]|uniref:Uncharacterized protein n=1 Tax=Solanum commersonii TaxID=4109 RepID=A0A9J5WCQ1_SOLCO|nr:hypothetical protein H5410_063128 [Solanum commersonii]